MPCRRLPVGRQARFQTSCHTEVRPGIEPDLRPYQRRVLPKHLQTDTTMIPDGFEPSVFWMSPRCLRHWTTGSYSSRDRSRTDKFTRFSTWSLFQIAYSAVCVAPDMAASGRSRGRTWQAKGMSLHWALAHLRRNCVHSKLQAPESNRSDRV